MNAFKKILNDKIIDRGVKASSFAIGITLCYIAFFYRKLPPLLPLYNQRPWGDARLASKPEFLFPSLLTISILILNTIICRFLYEKMPLVARILIITSLLATFLVGIFIFRITQLVL